MASLFGCFLLWKKSLGCSWGGFCSYYQARLGLDVLPAHATRGKGGVASDWLCLGREGALDPAINIVASLCADVRFFGLAQRMGAQAAGFLFLLGADWSGALVRPGFAGPWRLVLSHSDDPLAHTLGSWEVRSRHGGLLCSLPAASDVTTAHTPIWGRGRCIPLLV